MAMQQTSNVDGQDISPVLSGQELTLQVNTRLRELKFPYPSDENIQFVFETFVGSASAGHHQTDTVIHLQKEPQPGVPSEDVVDESGEVLLRAGEQQSPIPSIEQVRAMPLQEGPITIKTFGELFDVSRRAIYLAAMRLNSNWSDAIEDE